MTNFEWLNPIIQTQIITPVNGIAFKGENEKTNMFGVEAFIE